MKIISQLTTTILSSRLAAVCILSLACIAASSTVNAAVYGGYKWGPDQTWGTGATVTYSYMAGGLDVSTEGGGATLSVALESFMPAGYKTAIEAAFGAWSAVANINFVEVADSGDALGAPGATGDIRIGAHFMDGASGVLAHAFLPYPAPPDSFSGDIHFDSGDAWDMDLDGGADGFDIFQVFAHELGHAIGFGHETGVSALMNPYYQEAIIGLQADDIFAAQTIYGVRQSGSTPSVPDSGSTLLLLGIGFASALGLRRKFAA